MTKKIVTVNNKMQSGYKYELTEPMGKNFDPLFKPELTPKEMLELGVFGGVYMRDCVKTGEYPEDWFKKARLSPNKDKDKNENKGGNKNKSNIDEHVAELNYFGVNASQPLSVWKKKGWIFDCDPRGWFEWYCRYYMGRRIPEIDEKQIRRWRAMRRHIGQIKAHCRTGDEFCRPRQRQALLHWAYDSRNM